MLPRPEKRDGGPRKDTEGEFFWGVWGGGWRAGGLPRRREGREGFLGMARDGGPRKDTEGHGRSR